MESFESNLEMKREKKKKGKKIVEGEAREVVGEKFSNEELSMTSQNRDRTKSAGR